MTGGCVCCSSVAGRLLDPRLAPRPAPTCLGRSARRSKAVGGVVHELSHNSRPASTTSDLPRRSAARPRPGLGFLVTLAFACLEGTFSLFLKRRMGWNASQASYGFAFLGFMSAVVQGGLIRRLVARFGEAGLIVAGIATAGSPWDWPRPWGWSVAGTTRSTLLALSSLIGRSATGLAQPDGLRPPLAGHARRASKARSSARLPSGADPGPDDQLPRLANCCLAPVRPAAPRPPSGRPRHRGGRRPGGPGRWAFGLFRRLAGVTGRVRGLVSHGPHERQGPS